MADKRGYGRLGWTRLSSRPGSDEQVADIPDEAGQVDHRTTRPSASRTRRPPLPAASTHQGLALVSGERQLQRSVCWGGPIVDAGSEMEAPAPDVIDDEDGEPSETLVEQQVPMSDRMSGPWMIVTDEIVRQKTGDLRWERLERYQQDDPSIDHYIVYVDQLRRREES
jgi:hypothetical protein